MLCYKDQTFCSSDCTNKECFRFFGDEQKEGAAKWWRGLEGNPPIAFSDFRERCPAYTPPT